MGSGGYLDVFLVCRRRSPSRSPEIRRRRNGLPVAFGRVREGEEEEEETKERVRLKPSRLNTGRPASLVLNRRFDLAVLSIRESDPSDLGLLPSRPSILIRPNGLVDLVCLTRIHLPESVF